jgi:hypothetical protein
MFITERPPASFDSHLLEGTKKMTAVRRLYRNDRWLQFILLAFMVLYYGAVLSDIGLGPKPSPLNWTFNSMAQHLVHGRFDVDPGTIGDEGFLRGGHVYAYWGIWCALLRLPLLLVHRIDDLDITTWSCLAAVCLAGFMKVRTVLFLRRHCATTPASEGAFGLMLAYVVLGGSEVAYLKVSIFQEIVFWAVAFGAIFVYFAVKGIVSGQFTLNTLSWMALSAGLGLLTRVSTGIGLCMAFGLLLIVLVWEEIKAESAIRSTAIVRFFRTIVARRMLIPAGILCVLLIATGTVNYFRWGHPTTFADHTLYIMNRNFPDRMPRTHRYGYFNLVRIPFGLIYYFLPLWVLHGSNGHLLFGGMHSRLMDVVELPPSSFFLTDLLPISFIVYLVVAVWRRHSNRLLPLGQLLAIAAGLVVPCILMLTAISMNYRYRMEFYPEIDLLAFLGLYATVANGKLLDRFVRSWRWMLAAAIVSVTTAFIAMILYKLSPWGPSQEFLRHGLVQYYLSGE